MTRNATRGQAPLAIKFLVSVIIFILLFVPLWAAFSSCMRLSDQAAYSFQGLTQRIQSLNNGDAYGAIMYMDTNTLLVAFPANVQTVTYNIGVQQRAVPDSVCRLSLSISRPPACPVSQPCLCLCRDISHGDCGKPLCASLTADLGYPDGSDLNPSTCDRTENNVAYHNLPPIPGLMNPLTQKIANWATSGANVNNLHYSNCKEGFVLERYDGNFLPGNPLCNFDVSNTPRQDIIYVDRVGNIVRLCTSLDASGHHCPVDTSFSSQKASASLVNAKVNDMIAACSTRVPSAGATACYCSGDDIDASFVAGASAPQTLSLKCAYNINTQTLSDTPVQITLTPSGSSTVVASPDTYSLSPQGETPTFPLVNVNGKVCFVTHNPGATVSLASYNNAPALQSGTISIGECDRH